MCIIERVEEEVPSKSRECSVGSHVRIDPAPPLHAPMRPRRQREVTFKVTVLQWTCITTLGSRIRIVYHAPSHVDGTGASQEGQAQNCKYYSHPLAAQTIKTTVPTSTSALNRVPRFPTLL